MFYSSVEDKKYIQLVSGGSLVLDEGVWPFISCLSLWISRRWNWMIFSASSRLCCDIKPFLPAEAAPETYERIRHWEPPTWTSEMSISMLSMSMFIQVYPKPIDFTLVTSRVSRALDVLVKAALTFIVVQLHTDCAQLLTQIIDLFHKNDVVLDTDDRCEIFHTNRSSDSDTHTEHVQLSGQFYWFRLKILHTVIVCFSHLHELCIVGLEDICVPSELVLQCCDNLLIVLPLSVVFPLDICVHHHFLNLQPHTTQAPVTGRQKSMNNVEMYWSYHIRWLNVAFIELSNVFL